MCSFENKPAFDYKIKQILENRFLYFHFKYLHPLKLQKCLLLQWIRKWMTFDQMQNNSLQFNLLSLAKW